MGTYATPQIGHLDAALTGYGVAFRQNGLIADIICPRVPVGRQTDKYWIHGRENQQVKGSTLRAPGAPAARKRVSLSSDSYNCQSHAQASELPFESGLELPTLRQGRVKMLTDTILLEKEKLAAAMLTDTAKVTQNVTLAGASQFNDAASDPVGVIEDAKNAILKSGSAANTMIISPDVLKALQKHAAIAERFKSLKAGAVGLADLATVFNIDRVLLASGVEVDDAGAASWVWGKHCVLAYVQDSPSMEDVTLAKTFVWTGAPGTIGGFGVVTGNHPDPTAKSEIVGVDFYYDQKITAVAGGYLIKNAVA